MLLGVPGRYVKVREDFLTSKAGGAPVWPSAAQCGSALLQATAATSNTSLDAAHAFEKPACVVCGERMPLLVQIYAPVYYEVPRG